ncbi:MAG: sigma factor, partial [Pseudomonadota bacterium]
MNTDNVVEFPQADPDLAEEARIAAAIVAGIRDGSGTAESDLVERYSRGLRFLLIRRVGDAERASDLLQETLCIAIEKLREIDLDNPERLAGYLRGIAVRVAMNANRKRQREPASM